MFFSGDESFNFYTRCWSRRYIENVHIDKLGILEIVVEFIYKWYELVIENLDCHIYEIYTYRTTTGSIHSNTAWRTADKT